MNANVQATAPNILLEVNGIEVIYNHVILVLKGVSLSVPEGKIVALLGANGAGKTTTLRAISNLLKAERGDVTKGNIQYRGERIESLTPADLVKRGVVQVMEGRHCFAHLTVKGNWREAANTPSTAGAKLTDCRKKSSSFSPGLSNGGTGKAGNRRAANNKWTLTGAP